MIINTKWNEPVTGATQPMLVDLEIYDFLKFFHHIEVNSTWRPFPLSENSPEKSVMNENA